MTIKANKIHTSGFTLIELLVVIAIIGLLSTVVFASLAGTTARARDARRLSDMRQIRIALELFFDANGHYPGATSEGISNSGEKLGDDNGPIEQALSPYFEVVPNDPWYDKDPSVYYYSYDPIHSMCSPNPNAVIFAFNKAETSDLILRKDTTCGGDQNQNNADYNFAIFPQAP